MWRSGFALTIFAAAGCGQSLGDRCNSSVSALLREIQQLEDLGWRHCGDWVGIDVPTCDGLELMLRAQYASGASDSANISFDEIVQLAVTELKLYNDLITETEDWGSLCSGSIPGSITAARRVMRPSSAQGAYVAPTTSRRN